MTLFYFIKMFKMIGEKLSVLKKEEPSRIIKLDLEPNPRYGEKLWGKRPISSINKIITHQQLADGTTISTHNYHISKESHLKPGVGAPKIAYHLTIEKDGTIYQVNEYSDIVWHCAGQNLSSIGIMICGDFSGPSYTGKSIPTAQQIDSLEWLYDHLTKEFKLPKKEVYGHCDFGKENCPGTMVYNFIKTYKGRS